MNEAPPIVLCFSSNDPSGGTGISGDILTLASLGCHALPVVTALTTQDSSGIEEVMPIDPDWVSDQARFILEDMPVKAFKVGMVGSIENMAVIAEIVTDYPDIPLVLDPVFIPGDSQTPYSDEFIAAMYSLLVPYAHIVTLNSMETRVLVLEEGEEESELTLEVSAQRLLQQECDYVLITGTHENTPKVINTLYDSSGALFSVEWERLPGRFHGKGGTLSAALAGALANNISIRDAVKEAQEYTWQALKHGYRAGMGKHLLDRLFWARQEASRFPPTNE
jgi:hydroxymethylpyrimidine/phosphomethylpyrimidine kinase